MEIIFKIAVSVSNLPGSQQKHSSVSRYVENSRYYVN